MKILTVAQMRQAEQRCAAAGIPTEVLMENAGRAAAEAIRDSVSGRKSSVVVLAGPGNNGGDGLVAGRYLRTYGFGVKIFTYGDRPVNDKNLIMAQEHGLEIIHVGVTALDQLERELISADVVLDALLGIGKNRPISGRLSEIIDTVRIVKNSRLAKKIFALDIPSGMNADTGQIDANCLQADETITLGFPKVGLFLMPGAEYTGRIKVVDIGVNPETADSDIELITPEKVKVNLPKRPLTANKGTFGKAMIFAGSRNYTGAAFLACSGAMRVGVGLVTLAIPSELHPILASKLHETTFLPLPESKGGLSHEAPLILKSELDNYDALLVGPGIGRSEGAAQLIESVLFDQSRPNLRVVIDADALNILAGILADAGKKGVVWQRLKADAILTPHPGEMARLTGMTVEQVQNNRINIAREKAVEWQKTVVLKGAYTVIAAPDGRTAVSPFANPALASAGTGDVLAGVITGLVAQRMPSFEAALSGVFVHGKAGDIAVSELGDAGMVAGDLLPLLPRVIKALKS